MKILANSGQSVTLSRNPCYRSRLTRQAKALLQKQKAGSYLRNQQQRLLQRWQRIEAQKRDQRGAA